MEDGSTTVAEVRLEPADIFLTRGHGLLSRAIRFFTRSIGEPRTRVNHVGIVVSPGSVRDAEVVEALTRVRRHTLWSAYGPPRRDSVAVYRPRNLGREEIRAIVKKAKGYVGRRYGYLKVLAHLADWCLLGAYFFRRFTNMDRYPICSWLVAHSFKAAGKHFGVAPGSATPDDIWDFVTGQEEKYERVRPLVPLR